MIVLLDLDGTLVNTAYTSFKQMKDGLVETNVNSIPVFNGAKEFVLNLKQQGHTPIVLSDSHPRYVNPICQEIFNLPCLCLCDKPNTKKAIEYLRQVGHDISLIENFMVVGDTWLDIELARALNFPSVLAQFYTPEEIDERDGIGKAWHQLKSGPTYVVRHFSQIVEILQDPISHLWTAEAIFHNTKTACAIRLHDLKANEKLTAFRSLGRQDVGECDRFGIATYYTEFQREGRSQETLAKLAGSVNTFVDHVVTSAPILRWDYITYVSDKASTNPPNKMKDFFDQIQVSIPKVRLLEWPDTVEGSIRNRVNYQERRNFIRQNLHIIPGVDLTGKSVIVIDDQFTSGGTAFEVTDMLRKNGVNNILFLTLFFMTSLVSSNRICVRCGKAMQLKIKKSDGSKFFSCTPPKFRGTGCGHIENIEQ